MAGKSGGIIAWNGEKTSGKCCREAYVTTDAWGKWSTIHIRAPDFTTNVIFW